MQLGLTPVKNEHFAQITLMRKKSLKNANFYLLKLLPKHELNDYNGTEIEL